MPGRSSPTSSAPPSHKGHQHPVEATAHALRLYFRFPQPYRKVAKLTLQRGAVVSHETVHRRPAKSAQAYANGLCRRRLRPGDKPHPDEVFVRINREHKYLRQAGDQDGDVLDILLRSRRDAKAALRFMAELRSSPSPSPPRGHVPSRAPLPQEPEHRAQNSHRPTRQHEHTMKGFRSIGGAHRFCPPSTASGPACDPATT
ncbi:DDE-type integrase/transposase/recombinase [Streptomyces prasinus]|uniref:DDE-type integrase/transposase/recombinase n=1 Tax=Streptomyces prasinus TaxID=67345 RepID=UPI0036826CB1